MANAAKKVRATFIIHGNGLTLAQIKEKAELKGSEVSMALCHLRKMGHITREQIPNTGKGRKTVWVYTYTKEHE